MKYVIMTAMFECGPINQAEKNSVVVIICHLEMIIDAIFKSNLIKNRAKNKWNPFERLLHVLPSIRMKLELLFENSF